MPSTENEAFDICTWIKHTYTNKALKALNYWDHYNKGHMGEDEHYLHSRTMIQDRSDPDLVAVVEEMDDLANTEYSVLKVVEIPDDVEWEVEEYDGLEWIAENHRTWS